MTAIILYILLLLLSLAAISLNIISLPGNWLMLAAATCLWAFQARPNRWMLLIMLLILLVGECIELLGSLIGARKFGASKTAAWFAIFGGLVGGLLGFLIPVPLIGNLVGAIIGAFLAALTVELIKQKPFKSATWAAIGAALGRVMGMTAKIACGIIVWFALVFAAFPR